MAKLRRQRIRDPNARLQHIGQLPIEKQVTEIRDALVDIWSVVSYYMTREAGDYSVSGKVAHEFVFMNNSSAATVTLVANPKDHARVTVVQTNGNVTIDGNGKNINNGGTSASTLSLTSVGSAPDLIFSEDDDEWWPA